MSCNTLTPFAFDESLVRVITDENGNPLFIAKDVAQALGYSWNGAACICHVPDEWKMVRSVLTISGEKDTHVLTEQGLYFFLARSDKPKALPFQKWLAGEVLPAIRKTGSYTLTQRSPSEGGADSLPEVFPEEALRIRPYLRRRLWQEALQTARLDNGGTEMAVEWFARLCRLMTARAEHSPGELILQQFSAQCLVAREGGRLRYETIWQALLRWCRMERIKPIPNRLALSRYLGAVYTKKKCSNIVFCDVALNEDTFSPRAMGR